MSQWAAERLAYEKTDYKDNLLSVSLYTGCPSGSKYPERFRNLLTECFDVELLSEKKDDEWVCSLMIEEDIDPMSYTVSVTVPFREIRIEAGSSAAVWEGAAYFLSFFGTVPTAEVAKQSLVCYSYAYTRNIRENPVDNSRIIPVFRSEKETRMLPADAAHTDALSPDWLSSLIMAEVNLATCASDASFRTAAALVDFYASVGVNCIWLCPVNNRDNIGDGYTNRGPHTIDFDYTNTHETSEGWSVVRKFIDYAHRRQIRVLLDVVSWGVMKGSPICAGHPEWFLSADDKGRRFNWENESLRKWFADMTVENILFTPADGCRCDGEPYGAGYEVWGEIRRRLYDSGKKVILMSEYPTERNGVFDIEQKGISGDVPSPFLNGTDLAESVLSGAHIGIQNKYENGGTARYYANCITDHNTGRTVNRSRIQMGYHGIFSPFIPIWFFGDEFGEAQAETGRVYDSPIDLGLLEVPKNRFYFEDIKRMIRIRRTLHDIFDRYPDDHRDVNIISVPVKTVDNTVTPINGYLRYSDYRAILVIPSAMDGMYSCSIPLDVLPHEPDSQICITDLVTDHVVVQGTTDEVSHVLMPLFKNRLGIFLIDVLPM